MRILMLMQWCKPEPDFKCIPMAKALLARGHQVEVLTGFPNYPGGCLYPGYRVRLVQREVIEGVPVVRVPLYPSHDSSSFRRALNYGSFALSASLIGPFVTQRADVIYVYNPMGLPALVFRLLKRVPFVYDIQDLWPDSLKASGMMRLGRVASAGLNAFFGLVYRHASAIIVLSPGFKHTLLERGVPGDKVEVVYNWCNEDAVPPRIRASSAFGAGRFEVVYAGNLGKPQALDTVLDAAAVLQGTVPHARFTLIGNGTEKRRLEARATDRGLSNVRFLAHVPQAEISGYLAEASALLVHLKKDPLFEITVPSKIQFYLAVGKPLLVGVAGDARELTLRAGGGLVFDPEDAGSLAAAVERLASMPRDERDAMASRGRQYYQDELSLGRASARFEAIFAGASARLEAASSDRQ